MATKPAPAKSAPKTAPKATAKAATPAPAPAAPAAAEGEADEIVVGMHLRFVGYGADVPDEERLLEEGAVYPVVAIEEGEEGGIFVQYPNPAFNSKKKESDANPARLEVSVFPEEVEIVNDENVFGEMPEVELDLPADGTEGAAEVVEEAAPVQAAPAKGRAAGKTAAAAEAAPAQAAPAKGKGASKTKAAPAPAPEAVPATAEGDDLEDLDGEDESVLEIVNGSDNLVASAQQLEATAAISEYQLGGVLRHILKNKVHLDMEEGEQYNVPGGFKLFLSHYFNVDYRKAMYLIQIYEAFTKAGIESPAEAVARIGWTKASKIAAPMLEEGANADDLLKLAEDNTVADLSTALTEQVREGGTKGSGGELVKRLTLKFRFFEDEAATVNQILEATKEQLGHKDIGESLLYILGEYHATTQGTDAAAEVAPAQAAPKAAGQAAPKAAPRRATAKA